MKIREIYSKYQIPPNLQQHMFRVTGVAKLIGDMWHGPDLDKQFLYSACLLHDMGNILKFDLVNHANFLGEEEKNLEFWKNVKSEMAKKYGSDEHLATEKIVQELNVSLKVLSLVKIWGFRSNEKTLKSKSWEQKICNYSDQRIGPWGVLTLDQRFSEQRERYGKNWELSKDLKAHLSDDRGRLIAAAYGIEEQLQEKVNQSLGEITTEEVERAGENFFDWEI